ADAASTVLAIRRVSILPRIHGLVVLALVRARRGDPGHRDLLEEAWALAEPTDELFRMVPAAAARAEVAWLAGEREGVAAATDQLLKLAVKRQDRRATGELAVWQRRAGMDVDVPLDVSEPWASHLSGDWEGAATFWADAGCPYQAALALGEADDEAALRLAL